MMKRILFLLFAVGLAANMTVMAGMSTSKVRKETRFLTDKMAYELRFFDFYDIIIFRKIIHITFEEVQGWSRNRWVQSRIATNWNLRFFVLRI